MGRYSIAFILTCVVNQLSTAVVDAQELGETLYDHLCASCHGIHGVPPQESAVLRPAPTNLQSGPFRFGSTLAEIVTAIAEGPGESMPRFDNRLSSEQIQAIADYTRSLRRGSAEVAAENKPTEAVPLSQ